VGIAFTTDEVILAMSAVHHPVRHHESDIPFQINRRPHVPKRSDASRHRDARPPSQMQHETSPTNVNPLELRQLMVLDGEGALERRVAT
jgi:hypothetical protein